MEITKEIRAKALEVGKKLKVKTIWVNANGEFFTSQNTASLSVDKDADKYAEIDVSQATSSKKETVSKAEDIIAAIESAEDIATVEAILATEKAGKSRTSILEAGEKRIEALNKPE